MLLYNQQTYFTCMMKMYLRVKKYNYIMLNIKIYIIADFTNMNFHKRLLTFYETKNIFYIAYIPTYTYMRCLESDSILL